MKLQAPAKKETSPMGDKGICSPDIEKNRWLTRAVVILYDPRCKTNKKIKRILLLPGKGIDDNKLC